MRHPRERHPLFADEIAETQETPDAATSSRRELWTLRQAENRAARARAWLSARALLRAYEGVTRAVLLARWKCCSWPGDPEYLVSMMHMYQDGGLALSGELIHDYGPGAWRQRGEGAPSTAVAGARTPEMRHADDPGRRDGNGQGGSASMGPRCKPD